MPHKMPNFVIAIVCMCLFMPSFALAKPEERMIGNAWYALEFYMSNQCSMDRFIKLKNDHTSALNSSETVKRIWVSKLIVYLRECIYGGYPQGMTLEDAQSVLALSGLFWRGDFEKTESVLRQELTTQNLVVPEVLISGIPKIETLEQACPTVSLLNSETIHALRPSEQSFNNCFVHAAVKAADYYNYSQGSFTQPTSIVATTVGVGRDRTGDLAALGNGNPSTVINYLSSNGGCKVNIFDQIGEKKLNLVDRFIPRTRNENSTSFLPGLDLIIQQNFCRTEKNRFDGLRTRAIFELVNGVTDADLREKVREAFNKSLPQPLIVGFCAEAFTIESGSRPFGCADHAALIVGQRFDPQLNKCTYQILNSYGSSAKNYLPIYTFEPEYGAVWIPSDVLSVSLKGLWQVNR